MNSAGARVSVGQKRADIETPALLVDLDAMEQNLQTMARFFRGQSSKLRPHFKNHRVVELAQRQIEHGAAGITCARLWQAETLVHAGIRDILIANELAGEAPLRRFVELSAEAPVMVGVDNAAVIKEIGRLARDRRTTANVVVDVDLGLKRCGVAPGDAAVALAKCVLEQGLRFRGIMGYEGHLQPLPPGPEKHAAVTQAMQSLMRSKEQIEAAGIGVHIVSCGGTGDDSISASYPGVTENQAGSYLLMDSWYDSYAPDFRQSLSVLATVISKTPGERIVVDAGVKAISGERGLPLVKGISGLRLRALHAEHAPIEIVESGVAVEVGDKIEVSVHYHDGTIQLHSQMCGMRDGKVERVFSIEHGI
jgi:D-serine deaminase-like pyridoxal phosphate-dependent protein